MGTFETLQNLPLIKERTQKDLQTGTHVTVTPEDIESAVQTQQPISHLRVETLDTSATCPSSQPVLVPKVPTPKVPTPKVPPSKKLDSKEPEPELE